MDNELLITTNINKEPYIKEISLDKIINLTGQSGSGKSTYAKENYNTNDYLVIDTDVILSDSYLSFKGVNHDIGLLIREKFDILPNLHDNFDEIYNLILDYFKDIEKTIVIDSAQFHEMKNIDNLRGKVIVLRTSIDECYNRCINRYKKNHPDYTEEELDRYKEKKKAMYFWVKGSNDFILKISKL